MSQLVSVAISTPSRHPAIQKGYNPDTHRYHADYVNPGFWVLNLQAIPFGLSESSNGKPIIPATIASFQWTVKQVEGPFSKTITKGRSPAMINTEVQIPEPGEYEIALQVNLTNGEPEIHTRNYHLRDFLIVSIGDSFASGQGNPDVPAIPSNEDKAICKATTLALFIANIEKEWLEFEQGLIDKSNELIAEYVPYVGKVVVARLNNVEDAARWVKEKADNLTDWTVGLADTTTGLVVEGAKEVTSWFGWGDGGDVNKVEPQPAAWEEPKAYRSYKSGPALAARHAETPHFRGANVITFLSFARTGSEIKAGLLGPRTVAADLLGKAKIKDLRIDDWTGNRGQIEEARDTIGDRRIDGLIITITINDVGFSSLVSDSLIRKKGKAREELVERVTKKINEELPRDFDALKQTVDSQLNPRKVFITEYPIGIFKEIAEGKSCGVLESDIIDLDLNSSDAKALGGLGRLLNDTIRRKAMEFGWVLIDGIERDFDGHGYCAKESYFVSSEESCLNQGDFEGMLHPNKRGHEATRDRIALALRRELLAPQENWLEPVLNVMMRRGVLRAPQENWLEPVLNVMMR